MPAATGHPADGSNMVKKGVADFVESVRLVHSNIIFDIWVFVHFMRPISAEVCILQDLVMTSVLHEGGIGIFSDNIVKNIGNIKGIMKTSFSTIVGWDRYFDITWSFACMTDKSPKDSDCFVVGGFII